jgi:hypothetical protein
MGIWERNWLRNSIKRREKEDGSLLLCVTLCYRILDWTDLACGSWDTQLGDEW